MDYVGNRSFDLWRKLGTFHRISCLKSLYQKYYFAKNYVSCQGHEGTVAPTIGHSIFGMTISRRLLQQLRRNLVHIWSSVQISSRLKFWNAPLSNAQIDGKNTMGKPQKINFVDDICRTDILIMNAIGCIKQNGNGSIVVATLFGAWL